MKFLRMHKLTRPIVGILAGVCFVGLAIKGWGLSPQLALGILLFCVVGLVVLVALAAIFGFIIHKYNSRHD